ncbi:hypothetical protein G7054_g6849 [Neopestalotiopsis clavispora]|nr:hypothetical protein G7054_g6849 [Neopestalotiopsis clavispora]
MSQNEITPSKACSTGQTQNGLIENPSELLDANISTAPYTIFSLGYRWFLTILLGYLTIASSLTANIYFPLVNILASQYKTSIQAINLTITVYIVVQGISPSLFSPLADSLGRRPVFLLSFALYTLAGVGLVISTSSNGGSYASLLVLRGLQSAGGSGSLALAYAVVADVTVHAERGKFLGPMLMAGNLGPNIGPLIGGGAILATGQPMWAFLALVIFGGSCLAMILIAMRETNRTVVGNGSVKPKGLLWTAWMDVSPLGWLDVKGRRNDQMERPKLKEKTTGPNGAGKLSLPNPLSSLRLLLNRDAFTVLYLAASSYGAWYTIATSVSLIYSQVYGFNDLAVGCSYLAGGAGIITGGFMAGRLMDINYRHTAKKCGISVDRVHGDDMNSFPIEKSRARGSEFVLAVTAAGFVGYGWAVQLVAHPAVGLVLHALLVDIFPDQPGTAGAANNICRIVAWIRLASWSLDSEKMWSDLESSQIDQEYNSIKYHRQ